MTLTFLKVSVVWGHEVKSDGKEWLQKSIRESKARRAVTGVGHDE